MAGCETIKAFTEDVYAFGKLPSNATIVDGGGLGQVSLRIVEKILGLSFTVQGQARVIEIATSGGIEEEVRDRIAFQAHSSFDEQPVKGADVYLSRCSGSSCRAIPTGMALPSSLQHSLKPFFH
jgi:hypothetical protein